MHNRSRERETFQRFCMFTFKAVHLDVINKRRRRREKKKKGRQRCSATPSRFLPLIATSQVTAHRFLRRQRSLSATLTDSLSCV